VTGYWQMPNERDIAGGVSLAIGILALLSALAAGMWWWFERRSGR
jgi:hypothetical protein